MNSIPPSRSRRHTAAARIQVVSLDWKWLFIYPEQRIASVNQLGSGRRARAFLADLGERDERLLHPAARQHDLHDERHDDAAEPAGGRSRARFTACRRTSAATAFPDMHFEVHAVAGGRVRRLGSQATRKSGPSLDAGSYAELAQAERSRTAPFTYRPSIPSCSSDRHQKLPPGPDRSRPTRANVAPRTEPQMLGKLSWAAIPFDQPIPLVAAAWSCWSRSSACWSGSSSKGWVPYLWREWITSVDHKRIGVMYTLLAMVMLLRGFTDAIMMRSQQALAFHVPGLSAARALRPDLLRPRHDHDLLRGDAVRDRADEFRRAAAARRARRGVSDAQFGQLLADRDRRAAGQHLAGRRRVRAHRLAALSAAVGDRPIRPASASTIICGRCRSPASARC